MTKIDALKNGIILASEKFKSLHIHWFIMIALLLLSILGAAITDFSERFSHWYWLAMVPVFFAACLFVEWDATKASGISARALVMKQVMHWSGLLVAIYLAFHLQAIGSLDNQTTGLMLLLLLAITTFLAGVTMGWLFRLLGIFLAISLYLVAYLEHYLQIMMWMAVGILLVHHFLLSHYGHG